MEIYPKKCPICNCETNYIYRLSPEGKDEPVDWYKCSCGVIFQDKENLDEKVYNSDYIKGYNEEELKENYLNITKRYMPIIEDLTYGRMMLDVGFSSPINMNHMEERGWLTWGIDISPAIKTDGNKRRGDFLNWDFSLNHLKEKVLKETGVEIKERKFDLIWMNHVIEKTRCPKTAIRKAYNLLSETGVLFIASPEIDFINKTGVSNFPYWKSKENYCLFRMETMKKELEREGFEIILARKNYSSRYCHWYDFHIIAQKKYF